MRSCSTDLMLARRTTWNLNRASSQGRRTKYRELTSTFTAGSIVAMVAMLSVSSLLHAQSGRSGETHLTAGYP